MKNAIFKKVNWFYSLFSIDFYLAVTQQKLVLPFYHCVTSQPKPHLKHLGYYRSNEAFNNDINFFNNHFQSIEIKKIQYNNIQQKTFHISFDDGLSEVYSEAVPLLLKHKTHATLFINSDFIDNIAMFYRHKISLLIDEISNSTSNLSKIVTFFDCEKQDIYQKINKLNDENQISEIAKLLKIDFDLYLLENKPYLTHKQLQELQKMGFTIGNHSKNHLNFNAISFEQQQYQLTTTNRFLQTNLKINEFYFSFPYGDENIKNEFFEFMYSNQNILYSFGISGLKKDDYSKHLHRIPMEYDGLTAEQIIKFEYFYFLLKSTVGKNKIKR